MRDDFGIRFGQKFVAFLNELLLQFEIILDDSVMHDDDFALAVAVGMGIFFRWASVSGPASVPDAVQTVERRQANRFLEISQFSGCPANVKLAVLLDHGDSRRVISSIFQTLEAVQDQGNHFLGSDVADYSAHKYSFLPLYQDAAHGPNRAPRDLFRLA